MAAQGLRHTDEGAERIADRDQLRAIRRVGRKAIFIGGITSTVMTGLIAFGA